MPDLLAEGETEESLQQLKEGKIRLKSLKSRKGALKRKEKVVRGEVERFKGSLARLNAVGAASQPAVGEMAVDASAGVDSRAEVAQPQNATASRWAALRGFISATMEQNPAFVGKREDGK